jgi:anti-anti-sigma factor
VLTRREDTMDHAAAGASPIDRDLTIYHVAELKPRLLAWLQDGGSTLSLAGAQECDCAGLQLLVAARRAARAAGRNLVLTDLTPNALDALRHTGLDATFAA